MTLNETVTLLKITLRASTYFFFIVKHQFSGYDFCFPFYWQTYLKLGDVHPHVEVYQWTKRETQIPNSLYTENNTFKFHFVFDHFKRTT